MAGAPAFPGPPHPVLVIVCGLPGSGKTTLATRLARDRGLLRLGADEWMERLGLSLWDLAARARVEQLQQELAMELLDLGCGVVVEWGSWMRSQRDALREAARERGASVELHLLDAPDEELWRRVHARGREDRPVPLEEIRTWRELFEEPTAQERGLYDVGPAAPPQRRGPS